MATYEPHPTDPDFVLVNNIAVPRRESYGPNLAALMQNPKPAVSANVDRSSETVHSLSSNGVVATHPKHMSTGTLNISGPPQQTREARYGETVQEFDVGGFRVTVGHTDIDRIKHERVQMVEEDNDIRTFRRRVEEVTEQLAGYFNPDGTPKLGSDGNDVWHVERSKLIGQLHMLDAQIAYREAQIAEESRTAALKAQQDAIVNEMATRAKAEAAMKRELRARLKDRGVTDDELPESLR